MGTPASNFPTPRGDVRSTPRGTSLRTLGLIVGFAALSLSAFGLDEVVLKNGKKYLGTIIISTPEYIVLSIDDGTVKFPRSAIISPPYTGPAGPLESDVAEIGADDAEGGDHPLPSINRALAWLGELPEGKSIKQIPVMVTDTGRWRYIPAISFWVDDFFQLTFFGDPVRPAAIEVSLHHPPKDAWDEKRVLLEYVFGLAPGLAVDDRFEDLNIHGDSFAVGDLWFSITGPSSTETPERWSVLLMNDRSLAESRAPFEELQTVSETLAEAQIDPAKPRSWQEGSWTRDEIEWTRKAPSSSRPSGDARENQPSDENLSRTWTGLGGERVYLRAFERVFGHYKPASNDWLESVAPADSE